MNNPLNDPESINSRLAKLSGTQQETHNKIITDLGKQMGMKASEQTDLERIIAEGRVRIKNVRDYASVRAEDYINTGRDIDQAQIAKEVMSKLLDNFSHYDKDTTLLFLTRFLAELIMSEVV